MNGTGLPIKKCDKHPEPIRGTCTCGVGPWCEETHPDGWVTTRCGYCYCCHQTDYTDIRLKALLEKEGPPDEDKAKM